MGDHVGHKIQVKGTEMSANAAEAAEKGEKAQSEASHRHVRVASMKHLAATCP